MGMDGVEIVMAVEEAFSITIEDAEAAEMTTPGQLIDLVTCKLTTVSADVCLTQRSFYLLRRFFVCRRGFKRSEVRPEMQLDDAFPLPRRRKLLGEFLTEVDIKTFPRLVRTPRAQAVIIASMALGAAGTVALAIAQKLPAGVSVPLAIFGMIVGAGLATRATTGLVTAFPQGLTTAADLSRWIMMHKPGLADSGTSAWTREQVAQCVRQIVTDTLGCQKTYCEEAHFVKDLGMG